MPTFSEVMNRATSHVFEVEWLPVDGPDLLLVKTKVVANSFDEARRLVTHNIHDVRSIVRIDVCIVA